MMNSRKHTWRNLTLLAVITLAGLALRLTVWRWREFQALGGDEQEYLRQALTLLREHQYVELRLMRPPLYTLFLAASIVAVDSLVQNLRLIQALLSAATVPLIYLLTREVARWGVWRAPGRAALLAATLGALCYTLAANATELLTETLFMCGLTAALWLLLRAGRTTAWPLAALAGLTVGALCLVRSVGLPLLPLGALWLWANGAGATGGAATGGRAQHAAPLRVAVVYGLCALLLIAPWTARNALTYGGLIIIDTTGAENLWLDNDPAGREAVKAQLYALGEDRLLRQQVATRQGSAAILADPGRFTAKAWGELLKLFALEQSDDLLARRAIWVAPTETWARLILGDAIWLVLLLAGGYGLAVSARPFPKKPYRAVRRFSSGTERNRHRFGLRGLRALRGTKPAAYVRHAEYVQRRRSIGSRLSALGSRLSALGSRLTPAWLLAPWALYILLTTLIFHVELRYRLPLYPVLLPYTALALVGVGQGTGRQGDKATGRQGDRATGRQGDRATGRQGDGATGRQGDKGTIGYRLSAIGYRLSVPLVCLGLTLLHAPYPTLAWQLGWKHWHLGRADAALVAGEVALAQREAEAALALDEASALARVALARAALTGGDLAGALAQLDAAVVAVPAHPQAFVLRGDVRRALGDLAGARADLAHETSSRQDLQRWLWAYAATPVPARLALGAGLDLGFVRGFHALGAGETGFRWTTDRAELRLAVPAGAHELALRLASGRPAGAPPVPVEVWADGARLGTVQVAGWAEVALPLPAPATGGALVVELRTPTFTPRQFDRASPDGRTLGVQVAWAERR